MKFGLLVVLLLAAAHVSPSIQTELTVTAVNKLNRARQHETIELSLKDLAPLAEKDLNKLHVLEENQRCAKRVQRGTRPAEGLGADGE